MPINNLKDKISTTDLNKAREKRNPPQYEKGFEPSDYSVDFDILGDDFGKPSGGQSSQGNPFAGFDSLDSANGGGKPSGGPSFGGGANDSQFSIFNNNAQQNNGQGGYSAYFGGNNQPNQTQNTAAQQPTTIDKGIDASKEAFKSMGRMLVAFVKNIKNRTADDLGYLSTLWIKTAIGIAAGGIAIGLIGTSLKMSAFGFGGLGGSLIGCAIVLSASGLIGIGSAFISISKQSREDINIEDFEDITAGNDGLDDYLGHSDEMFEDIGLSDFDSSDDSEDSSQFKWGVTEEKEPESMYIPTVVKKVDYDVELSKVGENRFLTREMLVNTFKPFLPRNTPGFAEYKVIQPESEQFELIEAIALKAMASAAKEDVENIDCKMEWLAESYFCYDMKITRIKKLSRLDDIATEMAAYFRDSINDLSVTAKVDIEGSFYRITLTKGVKATVTLGDMMDVNAIEEFIKNEDNRLPFVGGVDEFGRAIPYDARDFDAMMIMGRQRSGKSWYVLNMLYNLMAFNTPEDVQFLIIDPKESNIFKTVALMPHVFGLHSDSNILDVLRDVIDVEASRRKRLLSDNRKDSIWELRDDGIKLPVLYVVIDEYLSVINNLRETSKEFQLQMQVLQSQLPSLGIRSIIVPHRGTGVVNKTNRALMSFMAAVRSDTEDIASTFGLKRWDRPLVNPGDMAVKTVTSESAVYLRGPALTTADQDNTKLFINTAKAFYKMGVEIPSMRHLRTACNRDEARIKEEIQNGGKLVQYSLENLLQDLN